MHVYRVTCQLQKLLKIDARAEDWIKRQYQFASFDTQEERTTSTDGN